MARTFSVNRDLLDIYVGTDEHIIKEEDLSLLRLYDLSPLAVHGLSKRLAEDQRPLLRVELLKGDTAVRSEAEEETASQRGPVLQASNAWRTQESGLEEQMSHRGLATHSCC